jgi:hypothetical protein
MTISFHIPYLLFTDNLVTSFLTPVTGLSRPNTGKEDDDDVDGDDNLIILCCVM